MYFKKSNILIIFSLFFLVAFLISLPKTKSYLLPGRTIILKNNTTVLKWPPIRESINQIETVWDLKEEMILTQKDFLEINLMDMAVYLYQKGIQKEKYAIKAKGANDDFGETPIGLFRILNKEKEHYSSWAYVYMPDSMRFTGNYYLHGLPYYANGQLTGATYSSGCVNLYSEPAKNLYALSPRNLPVLVLEKDFLNDDYIYRKPLKALPPITAQSYLVADIDSSQILYEKNRSSLVSAGTIVNKFIAGISASENSLLSFNYIFTTKIPINANAILYKEDRVWPIGERIPYIDLFYPMIIEHSANAAEALAQSRLGHGYEYALNERAKSMGLNNTFISDAGGYDLNNLTNAEDVFLLSRYLLKNKTWMLKISKGVLYPKFGQPYFSEPYNNKNIFYQKENFLGGYYDLGQAGLENGFGIFKISVNGTERSLTIVLLQSQDIKSDTEKILNLFVNGKNN